MSDPYRIEAAPPEPGPRSPRTPGRKALLVLLGTVFVVLAAANATLSLGGSELAGSACGTAALASLVTLVMLARKGGL